MTAELCIQNCEHFRQQRSVSFASNGEECEEKEMLHKLSAEEGGTLVQKIPYPSLEHTEHHQQQQPQHSVLEQEQQQDDELEPSVNLFLCCFSLPLFACARLVGWLSAVPLLLAMLLLPFAASSVFELIPEIILLGSEMLCVLSLFFGLQHTQPNYLRPFLIFGVIWNLALLLLLLFAVIELLVAPVRFCGQLDLTVQTLLHGNSDQYDYDDIMGEEHRQNEGKTLAKSFTMAFCFVIFLAMVIVLNGWLLNIVLLAYFYMKKMENEDNDIHQKLLLVPMRRRTLLAEDNTTPNCYSSMALTDTIVTNFVEKSPQHLLFEH